MKKHILATTVVLTLLAAMLPAGAAVAQDGAVGYAPTVRIDTPALAENQAQTVGTTFTIGVTGEDPDGPTGLPVAWRFLYRSAVLGDGTPVTTRAQYEANVDELVNSGDESWSPWVPYSADPQDNRVTFTDQVGEEYFLFAAQVIDTMGVVSLGRSYQTEVAHLLTQYDFLPVLTLCEYQMGCTQAALLSYQIAAGQPLNFAWIADASAYGGTIVSYRHGWDVMDPSDPNDPGWAVPPGLSEQNLQAAERTFQDGMHRFTVKVMDDSGSVTLTNVDLSVVPFIPRDAQMELLVIDQIQDANVMNWLDEQGNPRNDESYRNAWWQFLESGPGGVAGLDWDRDRFDHRDMVNYADIVGYKAVLCYAKLNVNQTMFNQFRAVEDTDLEGNPIMRDPYVWLTPYQERGGNFFLVGDGSMDSFLKMETNYMTPTVFDTAEPDWVLEDLSFKVSFGETVLPDGTVAMRGPLHYPYATAGIALLDWTSSASKYVYGRPQTTARYQRKVDCVGLKGLVLDAAFKSNHGVGAGDFPDTIMTDAVIDWQDPATILTTTFPWRDDEFVDGNISSRGTAWAPRTCADPAAPGGLCVEPMFRGMSRFDWLREFWWANGDPDWPTGGDPDYWDWGAVALADSCGPMALTSYEQDGGFVMPAGSARTNGQVYGYLSYKMTADKPGGAPDVFWGFDPYRFDNEKMKDVVRWVLSRNFGLIVLE